MTLRMLDSIFAANLPDGADAYLGYTDGHWPTFPQLQQRFGGRAHLLSMSVFASDDAEGCDREPGDLDVTQLAAWVKRQQARGIWRPVVYASASNMGACLVSLSIAGIDRRDVRLLSAHYKAGEHICGPDTCRFPGCPACDGTQWRDDAPGVNGSLVDESVLADDFFGGDMPLTHDDGKTLLTTDGVVRSPLADPGDNEFWTPASILTDIDQQARATRAQLTALAAMLSKQQGLDTDAIIAGVLQGLAPDQLAGQIVAALGEEAQQVLAALQAALAKASQ